MMNDSSTYQRRLIDAQLDAFQPRLVATEIYGAKGVGKTETALRRAQSILRLDIEEDVVRLNADSSLLSRLPAPLLVDEWQRQPHVWDLVRRAVDNGEVKGRYILTGSATAPKGAHIHSGAGRIVSMRMRPMSLEERKTEQPVVRLSELIEGNREPIGGQTAIGLKDYVHQICASGFPGIRRNDEDIRKMLLGSYLDDITRKEFSDHGMMVRNQSGLRSWLTSYAAATGTTASYNQILRASTPGLDDKPSKASTIAYRDALMNMWILDSIPAWTPSDNRLNRLTLAPKHFLADPALACRLLRLNERTLYEGKSRLKPDFITAKPIVGRLFEHLAAQSLLVYAQACDVTISHFRTYGGEHEVDFIGECENGGVIAFEVKLSEAITDDDVKHLRWLQEKIGDDLIDAVVLSTGKHAYRRADGIAVVPMALLGA